MEARILIGTLKETKQHTYKVEPQGLPNLIKKKMMKNLKDNWSKPTNVGVIYIGRKKTRWEKGSQTIKCVKMN
jgi:hypothetical protein